MERRRAIKEGALSELVRQLYPGAKLFLRSSFADNRPKEDEGTEKSRGDGSPVRLAIELPDRSIKKLVFHSARADEFGHDRRADRAGAMLLAYDTVKSIPRQVAAVDVGAVRDDGNLVSLRKDREYYLLTEHAEGTLYADDLRRIAAEGAATPRDYARAVRLADYLAQLHAGKRDEPGVYVRAIRDAIGGGDGVFGAVDSLESDVPSAFSERLQAIEEACRHWRWKLRGRESRLSLTHGDFHPFNVLFDEDELHLLGAKRGCRGEPADDVACLAANYLFFALEERNSWTPAFRGVWRAFWDRYLEATQDEYALEVVPPFLAWRALILVNPKCYPKAREEVRENLLGFAKRALDAGRLDPATADELF